ncbi:ABC transporter [Haloarcula hispanica N601]|uniref:Amino acid ABC transporter ATP-binding protein n=3 Tax=Haloarcula hispanica TaxID=51589 RepID=A0A482T219_HALHI|nr:MULTISPECIES: amino acid ABC transporter ATP-binding protein [Haloarcula]AEM56859.1 glutamine ABC transporter ATP-binding protein [Haloarcula hispanica ATCC 33960]AHB65651.1 ABC transporter [Haloarcula hispanica N601]AJF26769.1 glutamine ABC transporter ATP-binding protein [Haloarcula sp. CBA1115]KAA9407400.1 amino acid ABC transporter ATP-binding protein [Haloarcula sp. CBA1131]KAA9409556.1 amino acid ABC transporter ATP-binding protein [Haloarcula hispanica]
MTQPLLSIDDLHKSYGNEEVLEGVGLEMDQGDVTVLIGPSGSGKSTLLRCVNRLTEINSGRIALDGQDVTGADTDVNELRKEVGMVFQDFNLFAHLTALENVTLGPKKVLGMDAADAEEAGRTHLEQVGLLEQADSYPAELSGGQKQRVGIARALAMDPELLLFDEPTSALDPELVGEVVEVMRDLAAEGITMLVVSHEMDFARSAASDIVFLDDGEIVEHGPPEQLFQNPTADRTEQFLSRLHAHEETA